MRDSITSRGSSDIVSAGTNGRRSAHAEASSTSASASSRTVRSISTPHADQFAFRRRALRYARLVEGGQFRKALPQVAAAADSAAWDVSTWPKARAASRATSHLAEARSASAARMSCSARRTWGPRWKTNSSGRVAKIEVSRVAVRGSRGARETVRSQPARSRWDSPRRPPSSAPPEPPVRAPVPRRPAGRGKARRG